MPEVVRQLSERIAGFGHEVTVATSKNCSRDSLLINGVKIKEFDVSGNYVKGYSGEIENYKNFIAGSQFDILVNFAAQQWSADLAFDLLPSLKCKKVFVPTGFSGLKNQEFGPYFEKMKTWMRYYDMNVFLSNNYQDIDFARKHGIDKIELIPNGADEREFNSSKIIDIRKKLNIGKNDFLIFHVGSHTGFKGHREAIEIFKRSKIKNAVLLIVGNSCNFKNMRLISKLKKAFYWLIDKYYYDGCYDNCLKKEFFFNNSISGLRSGKKILVRQLTREDTIAAYKEADLFLFPSNIECSPIVLFECMASKTPFLATTAGNSAEIAEWSKSGVILPTITDETQAGYVKADIEKSSEMLENLYTDSELRNEMAENGYKIWKEKFTWEIIARNYEKLYLKLLES